MQISRLIPFLAMLAAFVPVPAAASPESQALGDLIRREMRAVFWLLTSTVPRVGRSIKAIKRSSVLLPAPDGPVRNTNSPRWMSSDTPESASRPVG